ncbi:MAG: pantetheine-phosphate adenylyltransferase [Alloprevotella sp.]
MTAEKKNSGPEKKIISDLLPTPSEVVDSTTASRPEKVAVFPGSFDPFTIGHASIVTRGLPLFDRIVIGVGVNGQKRSLYANDERVRTIQELYAAEPRVTVVGYTDLTIDLARREGAQFILRGLRSVKDFEYERDIAAMNHRLSGIETVLLFTEPQYAAISSSVVRELIHYGKDVSQFLPRKN